MRRQGRSTAADKFLREASTVDGVTYNDSYCAQPEEAAERWRITQGLSAERIE
jgi:hypothetical protein